MYLNNETFTYPILSKTSDDYRHNDAFRMKVTTNVQENEVCIVAKFYLKNKELLEHVRKGNLSFVLHVESQEGFVRKHILCSDVNKKISCKVKAEDNVSTYEITGLLIVTNCDAESGFSLKNSDLNQKYYDADYTYAVQKGTIVGFQPTKKLVLNLVNKGLEQSSFIRVASIQNDDMLSVDLSQEYIFIYLNEEAYKLYRAKRMDSRDSVLFKALVIFPAILYVLQCTRNEKTHQPIDEQFQDSEWWGKFEEIVFVPEHSQKDNMKLAQELMDFPIGSAISKYFENRSNEEDV